MTILDRASSFLLPFAGALAGVYLGASLQRTPECSGGAASSVAEPRAVPIEEPRARVAIAQGPVRATLDAEERRSLAAELARALKACEAEPAQPKPTPSPEAVRARADAEQLVERAQRAQEWTEADAQAFRALLPTLPGAEQQAVILSLVRPINEGRMVVKVHGPPF